MLFNPQRRHNRRCHQKVPDAQAYDHQGSATEVQVQETEHEQWEDHTCHSSAAEENQPRENRDKQAVVFVAEETGMILKLWFLFVKMLVVL